MGVDIMQFKDRREAALLLEKELNQFKGQDAIVVAIPRGGVVLGYQIAVDFHLPLDILLCKKIGHPDNKEYAIGSVCMDGTFNKPSEELLGYIPSFYIEHERETLRKDLIAKYKFFKGDTKPKSLKNKIVILTDDGIATGNTMLASVKSIRLQKPKKIIIAVPVASRGAKRLLLNEVDKFICLVVPSEFYAIGQFYENFPPITDEEVINMLKNEKSENFFLT